MPDPFRCTACGTHAAEATRCLRCGGRSFHLARPVVSKQTVERSIAPLFSLEAAREERERRKQH